jgi:glutathione S-transferase
MSIARYAARETCLAGKNSLDQALVESVAETINELREKLFVFVTMRDEAQKTVAINEYVTNTMPHYLINIDKFLSANNGGKGFLVGDKMTWADLHLFATVDIIRELIPAQAASALAKFPLIEQHVARIAAVPKIAEYLKKRGK